MARNYRSISISIGIGFILVVVAFVVYHVCVDKDVIKVGYMQISAHAPVIAAQDLHVFEKHGLDVKLEAYPDTPTLMEAVEKGQVDVGYQLTADAVLKSAAAGKTYYIYFVARSTEQSPIDGLYAMQDITADWLRGKKVGHFPGPTAEAMTKRILERAYGLKEQDFELVPTAPPLQLTSLKSGAIAALFTYEPMGTLAVEKIGAKRVLQAPVEKYVVDGAWDGGIGVFTSDLVNRRVKTAIAFQEAIYEAMTLLQTEKRGVAADAMSKLQPGLDVATAAKIPMTDAVIARTPGEVQQLEAALERQIAIYRDLGILPKEGRANLKIFRGEQ